MRTRRSCKPRQEQRPAADLIYADLVDAFREPSTLPRSYYAFGLARALRRLTGSPEVGWIHAAEAQAAKDNEGER